MNIYFDDEKANINLFLDWEEVYDQTSDVDGVCIAIKRQTIEDLKNAIENWEGSEPE